MESATLAAGVPDEQGQKEAGVAAAALQPDGGGRVGGQEPRARRVYRVRAVPGPDRAEDESMNVKRVACCAAFALPLLVTTACADRVTAADLAPRPSSIVDALRGREVQVGNSSGSPGARIRICNLAGMVPEHPPLYVVNGRKISHNDIHAMAIDPGKIQDIQIIKGAAATELYGAEAVNGAVLITLKP